jgi:hypothetical protein
MDVAFMQFQRHGWDIHAVWLRAAVVRLGWAGLVRLVCWRAAPPAR